MIRSRPIALIPTLSTVAVATLAISAFGLWFVMSATPVRAADQAVSIENFLFSPQDLTIEVGDTVTWTNLDSFSHTATSTSGPASFDSGNLATGDTFSFTFDTAGTYEYFCEIHPNMIGSITVTAATAAPSASTPASSAPAASTPASSTPASSAPAASSVPDTGIDAGVGASGTWQPILLVALVLVAGLGLLVTFRARRA
ncbi:MAG: cupredoxin family copper-binding protein [Chloroflexota bacterium]|nr:cupredoxin family copper-binding protein [Chloroflexota bacterium]